MPKNSPGAQRNESPYHRSIFSCHVYPTHDDERANNSSNFKSTSESPWKDPEVLYVNEKILKRKTKIRKSITKECSTQTSKTIIQLAQLETGYMSPDSLGSSPRILQDDSLFNCPYSMCNRLSDYTLDGSCQEQDCIFSTAKKNLSQTFLERPLTQTFLENRSKIPEVEASYKKPKKTDHLYDLKSKALIDEKIFQHPNYIQEPEEVKPPLKLPPLSLKPKSYRKSSRSLVLPDNSFVRRKSSLCYAAQNSFMYPTTSSQIKSKMAEIQSTNYLIPAMRRGRSTSPKPSIDERNFEVSKRIPYIDQSKSDISSSTTIINTSRIPIRNKLIDDSNDASKEHLSEEATANPNPSNASIDNAVCIAVNKFRDLDWRIALRGLADIVELCRVVDVDLIYDYMTSINQRLIDLLKSPRSHVCRTACQAAGHLFEYVKDTRRPEFDDIVDLLLHKTADANKFIRQDANLALDCMVTHISTFNAVRALCSKGPFHKNNLVRSATARLLICSTVIAGPDFVLNPNNNEYTRKRLILNLVRFLEDKNLETRRLAERLYKVLSKESRFDVYMKKYLEKDQIAKIKKTLRIIHKK